MVGLSMAELKCAWQKDPIYSRRPLSAGCRPPLIMLAATQLGATDSSTIKLLTRI